MPIPISKDVQINPAVLAAAGSAVDLNGLLLTDSSYAPVGATLSFSSAPDVADYFGSASDEYAAAATYFKGYSNCTQTPGLLLFSRFNWGVSAAWLRSGSFKGVSLIDLQAISGKLTLTISGTKKEADINLGTVKNLAEAAESIGKAAGDGVTVSFDTTRQALIIAVKGGDATSSLTFGSGTQAHRCDRRRTVTGRSRSNRS